MEESASSDPAAAASSEGTYTNLKVTTEGGVCTIMLNRPKKKNALTLEVSQNVNELIGGKKYFKKIMDFQKYLNQKPRTIHYFGRFSLSIEK